MISNIYSIYDVKAEAYLTPFFMQNDALLKRTIKDTLQDPNHLFGKHPEDYIVYFGGTFDDTTGTFELEDTLKVLFKLIDLKAPTEE